MQYYRNDSSYAIQAEQFITGNLDNFVSFIQGECADITIYPRKCAIIGMHGFGGDGILVVPDGYYLVMGSEIPNTIPKPLHEFSIVPKSQFKRRFSERPFKKIEITFSDTEGTENEMPI